MEENVEMKHRMAVYGSLLKGLGNHGVIGRHIKAGNARFVGEDTTEAVFKMLDLHAFPGLKENGEDPIHIEVYEGNDAALASVRALEGWRPDDSGMYREITIETKYGPATIYIYNSDIGLAVPKNDKGIVNWKEHYLNKRPNYVEWS